MRQKPSRRPNCRRTAEKKTDRAHTLAITGGWGNNLIQELIMAMNCLILFPRDRRPFVFVLAIIVQGFTWHAAQAAVPFRFEEKGRNSLTILEGNKPVLV